MRRRYARPSGRAPGPPTNLGEMVRCYRLVAGMSLRGLSVATGLSAASLMRIEHGYAIDAATLLRLLSWMLRSAP